MQTLNKFGKKKHLRKNLHDKIAKILQLKKTISK